MEINIDEYKERPITLSLNLINWLVMGISIVLIIICYLIYDFAGADTKLNMMLVLGLVIVSTLIHELIHGLVAARYAKSGWDSLKFGVIWKYGAAYCHCNEPLTVQQYIKVLIMPTFVTIFAFALSFIIGSWTFTFCCVIMLTGCIGDLIMLQKLKKEKDDLLIYDYPDKIGAVILEKKENE